jgi:hypothetical protein
MCVAKQDRGARTLFEGGIAVDMGHRIRGFAAEEEPTGLVAAEAAVSKRMSCSSPQGCLGTSSSSDLRAPQGSSSDR